MKELAQYLARALATKPDEVEVLVAPAEGGFTEVTVAVAQEDLTHLIGRQGRTARAIRTLLTAAGAKTGTRCNLKIVAGGETAGLVVPPEGPAETPPLPGEADEAIDGPAADDD